MPATTSFMNARSVTIEMEVPIAASPERVWDAVIDEIDQWWLPDFRCASGTKKVIFEARVGGQMYEDSGDGGGLQWFQVVALDRHRSMHLTGQVMPPFGGPAAAMMYLCFEAQDDESTVLKVTNCLVGQVDEPSAESMDSGWRMLFVDGLKRHVEGK